MKIKAFAKVNLYLDIVGKRADGYHELITLMCPIELCDTLQISFETHEISVSCDHPAVPNGPENIAHTAARRFFRAAAPPVDGVTIEIEKNIPVGAGLGGGSSNAAAVLSGLNACFDSPLSPEALHRLGKTIGADVPFFLYNTPAVATGIGDVITPFSRLRPSSLVLVYPRYLLSTYDVYKNFNLGLTKNEKKNTKDIFKLDWSARTPKLLFNALEPVAFELCPQIKTIKRELLNAGAQGALMSGSGSSVYGIFSNPKTAENAFTLLSTQPEREVFHTRLRV